MKKTIAVIIAVSGLVFATILAAATGGDLKGKYEYDDFEKAKKCGQCHVKIYYQWKASMMAQAFTHQWDEIEYFDLAVEHAKRDPKFKDAVDGCNGCHAPFSFAAGDVPPPRPGEGSMANEGVSCDVCHTISGYDEDNLYNFSYSLEPGRTKFGPRGGEKSPAHQLQRADHMKSAQLCATCHNEQSPWGVWVKSTYNEWLEGPYAKEGVPCMECHMPDAPGTRARTDGKKYPDVRQHLFHGGHVPGKTNGAIEVLIQPDIEFVEMGDMVVFNVQLFNQKAGHKIPTGSVEDRLLHLHVEAIDSEGNTFHIPVDKKGFKGEEYTIASNKKAYQDLADMMDVPEGFDGLARDGVPVGDRIFRMPYFTENGVMTMAQWNTASLGVDYRIGPRETKVETYTWNVPFDLVPGKVTIRATLRYQLLVKPVADFLGVPEDESKYRIINIGETEIEVL